MGNPMLDFFNKPQPSYTALDVTKDFVESCNINFPIKGELALSYLYDDTYPLSRETVDIDMHVVLQSDWDKFKDTAFNIATDNSKLGIKYNHVDTKVNKNGERLVVEFIGEFSGKFTIDMNYGTYCKTVVVDSVELYSPEMILADKLSVICNNEGIVRRRAKDLFDFFLVISNEDFELYDLCNEIEKKYKSRGLTIEHLSLCKTEFINDIYKGYTHIKLMDMPSFEEVGTLDIKFLIPVLTKLRGNEIPNLKWSSFTKSWNSKKQYGNVLVEDLHGTLSRETASGFHQLSTFPPFPIIMLNDKTINLGIIRYIAGDSTKYIESINENLKVTSIERTIVDLVDGGEYRIFEESIQTYLSNHNGDASNLYKVAKEYNKLNTLKSSSMTLHEHEMNSHQEYLNTSYTDYRDDIKAKEYNEEKGLTDYREDNYYKDNYEDESE